MTLRRRLARLAAGVLAVCWGFFFFGLVDLLAFVQGPEFHERLLLSTGWGLLFTFLVAAPLVAMAVAPSGSTPAALDQVLAAAVAVAVAAGLSASPDQLPVSVALVVTAVVVAALGDGVRALAPSGWHPAGVPAVLVLIAAGPLCAYAWTSARATGSSPASSFTAGLDHWPVQAALPLAVLLAAAFAVGHPGGWPVPTWCVSLSVAWFALVSGLNPDLIASPGLAWSVAAGGWAVAFAISTQRSGSRRRSEPGVQA
jgi:hypothetical protein